MDFMTIDTLLGKRFDLLIIPEKKTLIYDNAPQFTYIYYSWYGIKCVNICPSAPNMDAYTERVKGTIRIL
jgi:hypothetical protein